jgi:tetratricopeptide (TPR) repeat protein
LRFNGPIAPAATILILTLAAAVPALSQATTSANELQLGIGSYKDGQYEKAISHFQKAAELDPENVTARMYLATANVSQYIPGVDTPENNAYADNAIEQYQRVLDSGAPREQKIASNKGIGYLDLNGKKFDEARKYYQAASDLDPDDAENYYFIGVIDWTKTYQPRMEARARLGLKPAENLDPLDEAQKKTCDDLNAKNMPAIAEGVEVLNHAIQLRPDYDDAMAYLNLMYREKADVECDDLNLREEDLRTADHWVDMTLKTKKLKAEKQNLQTQTPEKPAPDRP